MKKNISFIATKAAGLLLLASFILAGCVKNLTKEEPPLPPVPPVDNYFNFESRQTVKMSIDYAVPGFQAKFQLFNENPLQNPETGSIILKNGVEPIYVGVTDKNGKFNQDIIIPSAVESAYLYTDRWGLRSCVKIGITGNTATYNAAVSSKATTRAASNASDLAEWFTGEAPYLISTPDIMGQGLNTTNIYSTVKWTVDGKLEGAGNSNSDVSKTLEINGSTVAAISKRAQNYLGTFGDGDPRKELLRDASVLNITTKEDGTKLNVVYLDEVAMYNNTFGYYYYKVGNSPHASKYEGFKKEMGENRNKYIIFPNVAKEGGVLTTGTTVALKFYGENGEIKGGTYDFPKGYVIGWFLNSNGFITESNGTRNQYAIRDGNFNSYDYDTWGNYISSDDQLAYKNKSKDFRRFITLADTKSKTLVIGIEDKVGEESKPDDYCDLTFLVTSNKDLTKPELPPIPDVPEEPIVDESFKGTLAFEDLWPYGGDYDMNDVVVEYNWKITIKEDGYVGKLEEKYKPVHYGASLRNYFAYQLPVGTVSASEGLITEASTNSVRIEEKFENCINKEYTVTRTFSTQVKPDELKAQFNPYIIITNPKNEKDPGLGKDRKEVHLPKQMATELADKTLQYTQDDAYYVDKDGKYPFAINIPIVSFKVATEKSRIDIEYPKFILWSESKGTTNQDWYNHFTPIK